MTMLAVMYRGPYRVRADRDRVDAAEGVATDLVGLGLLALYLVATRDRDD